MHACPTLLVELVQFPHLVLTVLANSVCVCVLHEDDEVGCSVCRTMLVMSMSMTFNWLFGV